MYRIHNGCGQLNRSHNCDSTSNCGQCQYWLVDDCYKIERSGNREAQGARREGGLESNRHIYLLQRFKSAHILIEAAVISMFRGAIGVYMNMLEGELCQCYEKAGSR